MQGRTHRSERNTENSSMEAIVDLPGNCRVPTGRTLFKLRAILQRDRLLKAAMLSAARTPHISSVAIGSSPSIVLSMGAHRTHRGWKSSTTLPRFVQSAPETTHGKESLCGNQKRDSYCRCECTGHQDSTIS